MDSILRTLSPRQGFFCFRNPTGGFTPVCDLSSLRDFSQAHISCFSSEMPMDKNQNRRKLNFSSGIIIWQTIHGQSANYPRTFGKLSTDNRQTIHRHSANYPQTFGKLSTDNRQTIHRDLANYPRTFGKLSTDNRQTIHRHFANYPRTSGKLSMSLRIEGCFILLRSFMVRLKVDTNNEKNLKAVYFSKISDVLLLTSLFIRRFAL